MNWKLLNVFLFLCVISQISSNVIKQGNLKTFSFDDVVRSPIGFSGFNGTWISNNEFTYKDREGNFNKINMDTKVVTQILSSDDLKSWGSPSLTLSADAKKVLLRFDVKQVFRHSSTAKYAVYNIEQPDQTFNVSDGSDVSYCVLAPNGESLAYVLDNNIYHVMIDGAVVKSITNDGVVGQIFNGISDWVYEEEVLGSSGAVWFSPDSEKLVYMRFDDTLVKEFTYELYGEADINGNQYPEEVNLRYPKAGATNPEVKLFVVNLQESESKLILAPSSVTTDHILGAVTWINNDRVGAIWLNRRQNFASFQSCDLSGACIEITSMNEPNGWIDAYTPKCIDNECFMIANYEGWRSLISVSGIESNLPVVLKSQPRQTITGLYGVAPNKEFYASYVPFESPQERHTMTSTGCLTCSLKTFEGNDCSFDSATFSKDFSYYSLTCSGPDPSTTRIFKVSEENPTMVWEENLVNRRRVNEYELPQIKYLSVPIAGGFQAVVKIQFPNEIDLVNPDSSKKYPMMIRVYGGPGSTQITNSFSLGYKSYLIGSHNVIHLEIDGRGSGNKGLDLLFSINNKLGTFEMIDQISVTKEILKRYSFIDPERVGIWGWSYGGYATAMTLAKDSENVFKCGISVAPVTSWMFYDSIYTERFMGLPTVEDNLVNYNQSDVSNYIQEIGKHDFFLIHGNGDDNVHFQQSMVLARAMELANINFEQMWYPNEAHSISGTQLHLYHTMDQFWSKCLKYKI